MILRRVMILAGSEDTTEDPSIVESSENESKLEKLASNLRWDSGLSTMPSRVDKDFCRRLRPARLDLFIALVLEFIVVKGVVCFFLWKGRCW